MASFQNECSIVCPVKKMVPKIFLFFCSGIFDSQTIEVAIDIAGYSHTLTILPQGHFQK